MKKIVLFVGLLSCVSSASAAPTSAPVDITALKQQRAQAVSENVLITQVNAAQAAKDWPKVESLLQQLITLNPGRWQYRQSLADAEMNQGKYHEALEAYGLALHGALVDKTKFRQALALMYTSEGNANLKLKRDDAAVADYEKAAGFSDNPGTAWFNVCVVDYNLGKTEPALAACDKAIAADPKKADAWFVKGSILVADSTVDAGGKTVAPPGAAEALQMYLKLAPAGAHADDTKQMLDFIAGKSP